MPQVKSDFTILYGSQTGQAQAISEEIFDRAFKEGFNPVRFCLGEIEKKFAIEKETCVVIVCSTTGEGEPPDNATKFVRRIRKKTLSSRHLQNLSYAVLGLGDSNYTNFCNCPKTIVTRLLELGASEFYETGYGDDAVGLEDVVEPWIDGLFPVLRKHLRIDHRDKLTNALSDIPIDSCEIIKESNLVGIVPAESAEIMLKDDVVATLRSSVPPLCDSTLKIPSLPPPFLKILFCDDDVDINEGPWEYPSAATGVKDVSVTAARQLTFDSSVKKCLELELDIKGIEFEYEPGDSFGVICENEKSEVDYLLERFEIADNVADKMLTLGIIDGTAKKAPSIPEHLHCPSTLRNILTRYVDFRDVPRKAFLRMLVDYTSDASEKRRLQELCSTQGAKDYTTFIRERYIGLIHLLQVFKSCKPPVERVLELLPRLLSREYSIASYHGDELHRLKFVFNVIELPEFERSKRYGLCTSWLDSITTNIRSLSDKTIDEHLKNLSLQNNNNIKLYFRRPTPFRFPDNPSTPLIMIGPGTGVAPFIGFLQKREFMKNNEPSVELGTTLLFFGCRYKDKDFLYEDELNKFKKSGILSDLFTSFSRDVPDGDNHTKYVQENIRKQKDILLQLIFEKKGAVFICGDAKHMGRDVTNLFVELIEKYKGVTKLEGIQIINDLREKKQFLEDVWT